MENIQAVKKYRPDIDGLRAIAVLSVILYHAYPKIIKSGFVGVDIFFVISGFLITRIIFEHLLKDSFSFRDFYIRRIRRIFPAFILVLLSVLLVGWFGLMNHDYQKLGKHVKNAAIFISNFTLDKEVGYFDEKAELKPLLHLWSLSIEEQFYLLWPFTLFILYKLKRNLFLFITAFLLISLFFNILYVFQGKSQHAFYMPHARFWELMTGALLAIYIVNQNSAQYKEKLKNEKQNLFKLNLTRNNMFISNIISCIGTMLLFCSFLLINKTNFTSLIKLLPVLGTLCIIWAGQNAWINKSIFSHKALISIGLISFPLYLWHWPILSFAKITGNYTSTNINIACLIFLSFILSIFTFYFVEKPIRFSFSQKTTSVFILCTSLAVLMVGGIAVKNTNGFHKFRVYGKKTEFIDNAMNDWTYPEGLISLGIEKKIYAHVTSKNPPKILFIGDSHIEQYSPRVLDAYNKNDIPDVLFITGAGCLALPFLERIPEKNMKHCILVYDLERITALYPSIRTIVFGGYWSAYINFETKDIQQVLNRVSEYVTKISQNYKVFIILDINASPKNNPRSMIVKSLPLKLDVTPWIPLDKNQQTTNSALKSICDKTGISCIDPAELLCKQDACKRFYGENKPIFKDNDHLTASFVKEAATYLDPVFK